MKRLKLEIVLTYDAKLWHGNDKEAKDWFFRDVLKNKYKGDLVLHSNEVGDAIGTIEVIKIKSI